MGQVGKALGWNDGRSAFFFFSAAYDGAEVTVAMLERNLLRLHQNFNEKAQILQKHLFIPELGRVMMLKDFWYTGCDPAPQLYIFRHIFVEIGASYGTDSTGQRRTGWGFLPGARIPMEKTPRMYIEDIESTKIDGVIC